MSADVWTLNQVQSIAGKMLSVHAHEGTCLASQCLNFGVFCCCRFVHRTTHQSLMMEVSQYGILLLALYKCYLLECPFGTEVSHAHSWAAMVSWCVAVQDMFYDLPYNLDSNSQRCLQQYGVTPQYNWAAST